MRVYLWPLCCVASLLLPVAAVGGGLALALPESPPAPAAAGSSLSLNDAIARAFSANPELRIAQSELEASQAVRTQVDTLPNPELSLALEDLRAGKRTTTLQLSERLELGGKRQARTQVAMRLVDIAHADQLAKRQALQAQVSEAFYQALAAQESTQLSQSALALAQRVHDVAARRLAAGKVAPIEVSKAQVAQVTAQLQLSQQQSELRTARNRLASLLGQTQVDFVRLEGKLDLLPPPLRWEQLAPRLQQAPEWQRAEHERQRRQADIALQRSLQVPDITFSAGMKRDEMLGENMVVAGISVPIPLFQQNQGGVLEALRRADKAEAEQQSLYLRNRSQLAQALERFNNAREEAESLRQQLLPVASEAYELASKGYELGKFTILDVLDAQRSLFQVRGQYLRVLLEVQRSAIDIERISGDSAAALAALPASSKQE